MKLNYFVIGTNNMDAAVTFYNALFDQSGIPQVFATERMTYWQGEGYFFAVALPFDEEPATFGNGTMLGFEVNNAEDVTRLHDKVIELGGHSEGAPMQRGPKFSAYARDLDGNKLSFYV